MGIPAVIGSAGSELMEAVESGAEIDVPMIAVGIAVAFVVGLLSIFLLKWIMKKDRLGIFGYYTAFLGAVVIILGTVEHLCGLTVPQLINDLLNRGVVLWLSLNEAGLPKRRLNVAVRNRSFSSSSAAVPEYAVMFFCSSA